MTNKTVLSDKEIEKGRQAIFSTENPFCPCDSRTMQKAARWVEQALLQSPEMQQALADSKRIDWLADPDNHIGNVQLPIEVVESNLHSLRDAIDAAMEVKP